MKYITTVDHLCLKIFPDVLRVKLPSHHYHWLFRMWILISTYVEILIHPSLSMKTSTSFFKITLTLNMVYPKMTDQANLSTECSHTCWTDMCRDCSCASGSELMQLMLALCFSTVPCFISWMALVDEATPGRAVCASISQELTSISDNLRKAFVRLWNVSSALHASVFLQRVP